MAKQSYEADQAAREGRRARGLKTGGVVWLRKQRDAGKQTHDHNGFVLPANHQPPLTDDPAVLRAWIFEWQQGIRHYMYYASTPDRDAAFLANRTEAERQGWSAMAMIAANKHQADTDAALRTVARSLTAYADIDDVRKLMQPGETAMEQRRERKRRGY